MKGWPLALTMLGALLHAILLLVPSGILFATQSWNVALLIFVLLILTAGIAESLSICREEQVGRDAVVDPLAIRMAIATGIGILMLLWLAQVECAFLRSNHLPLSVFGAALVVAGIGLRVLAIRTLGAQFVSDICRRGPKVNHGIYRWISHPSELGMVMIVVGACLVLCAVATAMLAFVVLTPISVWRMRRENLVL